MILTNHHTTNTTLVLWIKGGTVANACIFLHPSAIFILSNVIIFTCKSVFPLFADCIFWCFLSFSIIWAQLSITVWASVRRQCCSCGLICYVQSFLGVSTVVSISIVCAILFVNVSALLGQGEVIDSLTTSSPLELTIYGKGTDNCSPDISYPSGIVLKYILIVC